jgi:hypothetical protein
MQEQYENIIIYNEGHLFVFCIIHYFGAFLLLTHVEMEVMLEVDEGKRSQLY